MKARSASQILAKIACPHLSLYRGEGYWYFVYDNAATDVYATRTTPVMYLNSMTLDQWVEEGLSFVKKAEGQE